MLWAKSSYSRSGLYRFDKKETHKLVLMASWDLDIYILSVHFQSLIQSRQATDRIYHHKTDTILRDSCNFYNGFNYKVKGEWEKLYNKSIGTYNEHDYLLWPGAY